MADNHFENFTHSVAAARVLLAQAQQRGSLIEGLALYASVIDALLRNLVALKTGEREIARSGCQIEATGCGRAT
jgi:hypothetical protein